MQKATEVDILTTDNAKRWREILEEIGGYDFYHLPAFHRLAEMRGEGKAVMPVFRSNGFVLAFPMMLREIELPGVSLPKKMDATSVLGFAGPVSQPDLPESIRQLFLEHLQKFFLENDIVTVFSRLNPLTCESGLLNNYGEKVEIGVTLSIDLTLPPEVQLAQYRHDQKHTLNKLRSEGYVYEEAGIECLDYIYPIYMDTMERLQAIPAFRYDRSYFEYLLTEMRDVMHLFVCKKDKQITGFRLFSECGRIVSSYLSGTAEGFLKERSSGMLYDAGRILGNRLGARVLHLGGGMGAQRDSLYDFKKSFATDEHIYRTWRHVVDPDCYELICRRCTGCAANTDSASYFPAYRDPSLIESQKP